MTSEPKWRGGRMGAKGDEPGAWLIGQRTPSPLELTLAAPAPSPAGDAGLSVGALRSTCVLQDARDLSDYLRDNAPCVLVAGVDSEVADHAAGLLREAGGGSGG